MNALAQPASSIASSAALPLLRTLVLCDLVDSTALTERLGDQRAADLFRKHDRLARTLLPGHGGREIDKTDGFLLMFERPLQAVAFALDYLRALRELNADEGTMLAARIGIHVGDLVAWDNSPEDIARGAKPIEVEGLVKPITARLTQLALPNQILLSGVAHALAHRAQGELGERLGTVRWRTHGRYRFKGIPDPIPVFEVGDEGFAPLKAPPWSGKAHREVPFWRRPATLGIELAAVLALLVAPAWYLLKPAPAIAFAQRDWVVVGDLRNLTGDTSFDASIQTAFRIGLEQSRYVNVLSTLKARETVQRMRRDPEKTPVDRAVGAEIAIRDGARAVILPTIAEIGGRVRVTAEVVDPQTQTTVYSESADGIGAESVLPSLDAVNQKLRVRLGEALATVQQESKPLARVVTKNLDALRAYSLGMTAFLHAEKKQAIALLRQAIQIDPDFALARVHLGEALLETTGNGVSDAITEVRRATGSAERLSPRDKLYAQAWLATLENPAGSLDKWRLLAKLYPDYTEATGALGFFEYFHANDFAEAIRATELNAVDTNANRAIGDYLLGVLYLGSERYPKAEQRFSLAIANGHTPQENYRAYLYATQRQFAHARTTLASGKKADITADDARVWAAPIMFALDEGDWKEAFRLVERAEQDAKPLGEDLHRTYLQIGLSLRSIGEEPARFKTILAEHVNALPAPTGTESHEMQFERWFSAYFAEHAGATGLSAKILANAAVRTDRDDYPYLSNLRRVVEAERLRVKGEAKEAAKSLEVMLDGREYYFAHRVLMNSYGDMGDYAHAYEQAQWLIEHRGRAYAEQFGQAALKPFNVALSDMAWLDAAEYAAKRQQPETAKAALATFKKNWPNTQQLPFLQQRLRELDQALGITASTP